MGLNTDAIIDYNSLPGKHIELPRRYSDFAATDLSYTVRRGPQEYDIELTP